MRAAVSSEEDVRAGRGPSRARAGRRRGWSRGRRIPWRGSVGRCRAAVVRWVGWPQKASRGESPNECSLWASVCAPTTWAITPRDQTSSNGQSANFCRRFPLFLILQPENHARRRPARHRRQRRRCVGRRGLARVCSRISPQSTTRPSPRSGAGSWCSSG